MMCCLYKLRNGQIKSGDSSSPEAPELQLLQAGSGGGEQPECPVQTIHIITQIIGFCFHSACKSDLMFCNCFLGGKKKKFM